MREGFAISKESFVGSMDDQSAPL